MEIRNKQLFLSCFFNQQEITPDNAFHEIVIPHSIPVTYFQENFAVTPYIVLTMLRDFWNHMRENEKYLDGINLNPKIEYVKINQKLSELTGSRIIPNVKYQNYLSLIYDFDKDEEWFDEHEIKEFVSMGYHEIDLRLINAGQKRNYEKVIKCLENKANPYISIDGSDNYLVELLSVDLSFYSIESRNIFDKKTQSEVSNEEILNMFSSLYGVASSSSILNLFDTYFKSNN